MLLLVSGLDTLGDDLQADRLSQTHDGLKHGRIHTRGFGEEEFARQLHRLQRQVPQRRKTRPSGVKIVQPDPQPLIVESTQVSDSRRRSHRRFADLDDERIRWQAEDGGQVCEPIGHIGTYRGRPADNISLHAFGRVSAAFVSAGVTLSHGSERRVPPVTTWSLGRWARVTDRLEGAPEGTSLGARIAQAAKSLLAADAVSLTMSTKGFFSAINGADEVARTLDELQFTVGQGPTVDAMTAIAPVIVEDLRELPEEIGLTSFYAAAGEYGVRALVALPMRVGAARLGVLTAYKHAPGWLSAEQYADGLVLASLATSLLLEEQARVVEGEVSASFDHGLKSYANVHLAAGILSERLNLPIDQALIRLRATAFANDVPLHVLADQVVHGDTQMEN